MFTISGMSAKAVLLVACSLSLVSCSFDASDPDAVTDDPLEIPTTPATIDTLASLSGTNLSRAHDCLITETNRYILTGNAIMVSDDRGATWTERWSDSANNAIVSRLIQDPSTGVILGTETNNAGYNFIRSTDDGETWTTVTPATLSSYTGSCLGNDGNGVWICSSADGGNYALYRSTDAGDTWALVHSKTVNNYPYVTIATDSAGNWMAGTIGSGSTTRVTVSTDNGFTWSEISPPTAYGADSIAVSPSGVFLAGDQSATGIYRATNFTGNWVLAQSTSLGIGKMGADNNGNYMVTSFDGSNYIAYVTNDPVNGPWSSITFSAAQTEIHGISSNHVGEWLIVDYSLNYPIAMGINGSLLAQINALESWLAEKTGDDEITITAAWPGKRPVPTSPDLTITTTNIGAPDRALAEISSGNNKIQLRAFDNAIRLLAINESTWDFFVDELAWTVAGFRMVHIGSDGSGSLWFKVEGLTATRVISTLSFVSGQPTVSLFLQEAFNNYFSETWLHPTVDIDHALIASYRTQNQPWGTADVRDLRIQAADGRDINYVVTNGGKHKFIGEIDGMSGGGVELLTADPVSPTAGQMWLRTDLV